MVPFWVKELYNRVYLPDSFSEKMEQRYFYKKLFFCLSIWKNERFFTDSLAEGCEKLGNSL